MIFTKENYSYYSFKKIESVSVNWPFYWIGLSLKDLIDLSELDFSVICLFVTGAFVIGLSVGIIKILPSWLCEVQCRPNPANRWWRWSSQAFPFTSSLLQPLFTVIVTPHPQTFGEVEVHMHCAFFDTFVRVSSPTKSHPQAFGDVEVFWGFVGCIGFTFVIIFELEDRKELTEILFSAMCPSVQTVEEFILIWCWINLNLIFVHEWDIFNAWNLLIDDPWSDLCWYGQVSAGWVMAEKEWEGGLSLKRPVQLKSQNYEGLNSFKWKLCEARLRQASTILRFPGWVLRCLTLTIGPPPLLVSQSCHLLIKLNSIETYVLE